MSYIRPVESDGRNTAPGEPSNPIGESYTQIAEPYQIILDKVTDQDSDGVKNKTFKSDASIVWTFTFNRKKVVSEMENVSLSILWDASRDRQEYLLQYDISKVKRGFLSNRNGKMKGATPIIDLTLLNSEDIPIGTSMTRFALYEFSCGKGGVKQRPRSAETDGQLIVDHERWRQELPSAYPFVERVALSINNKVSWCKGCK